MVDTQLVVPLEPWYGYGRLEPSERTALFARKFEEAKMQGDQAYAVALAAAVGNYELLLKLQGSPGYDGVVERTAADRHDDGQSWVGS